jgi:hypothetical protein
MHHNMSIEAAAELSSMVEMLISRREQFERLEYMYVWIHPDSIS